MRYTLYDDIKIEKIDGKQPSAENKNHFDVKSRIEQLRGTASKTSSPSRTNSQIQKDYLLGKNIQDKFVER